MKKIQKAFFSSFAISVLIFGVFLIFVSSDTVFAAPHNCQHEVSGQDCGLNYVCGGQCRTDAEIDAIESSCSTNETFSCSSCSCVFGCPDGYARCGNNCIEKQPIIDYCADTFKRSADNFCVGQTVAACNGCIEGYMDLSEGTTDDVCIRPVALSPGGIFGQVDDSSSPAIQITKTQAGADLLSVTAQNNKKFVIDSSGGLIFELSTGNGYTLEENQNIIFGKVDPASHASSNLILFKDSRDLNNLFAVDKGGNTTVSSLCLSGVCKSDWDEVSGADVDWTISGTDMYSGVSGNIGIGTTNPAVKLDIVSNVATPGISNAGTLRMSEISPQIDFIDSNGNDWAIHVNSDKMYFIREPWNYTDLVLDGTGRVGIGTSTPITKLDVVGGDIALENGRSLIGRRTAGQTGRLVGIDGNIVSVGEASTWPDQVRLYTPTDPGQGVSVHNGSESIAFFRNDGNVGIGTNNPEFNLDVFAAESSGARIGNAEIGGWPANSNYAYFGNQALDHSTSGNYALLQAEGGTTYLNSASGTGIYFRENNSDRMALLNGDLNIGTTAADGRLVIDTPVIPSEPGLRVRIAGNTALKVDTNEGLVVGSNATAPSEGLYVKGSTDFNGNTNTFAGAMGIGVSSLESKLHVKRMTDGQILRLEADNKDIDFYFGEDSPGYGFYWRYKGTQSGNNNELELWAENQNGSDPKQVYEVKQDGKMQVFQGLKMGPAQSGGSPGKSPAFKSVSFEGYRSSDGDIGWDAPILKAASGETIVIQGVTVCTTSRPGSSDHKVDYRCGDKRVDIYTSTGDVQLRDANFNTYYIVTIFYESM